jgi:hypothetical protein
MSSEYGVVINVATINAGAYLTADAAISDTVLFLDDVSVFDDLGGQVSITADTGATEYFYTAIDLVANTMTLQTGLTVAAAADTGRAEIWPPAPIRTAFVQFGIEEAEAVRVRIPHTIGGMPDGVRLSNDQEIVLVEERKPGELYLKDVMARGMIVLQPGDNLDTFVSEGNFVQMHSVYALASLNYPPQTATGAWAGFLEVLSTRASTLMMQRYTGYRSTAGTWFPSVWVRSFAGGIWSGWVSLQSDTDEISTVSSICVAQTGWSVTSAHLRVINKVCYIMIYVQRTGATIAVPATGDIANTTVCQMIAAYRPGVGYTQGGIGGGNTGRMCAAYVQTDGIIGIGAVGGEGASPTGLDILVNDQFSIGGSYLLQ